MAHRDKGSRARGRCFYRRDSPTQLLPRGIGCHALGSPRREVYPVFATSLRDLSQAASSNNPAVHNDADEWSVTARCSPHEPRSGKSNGRMTLGATGGSTSRSESVPRQRLIPWTCYSRSIARLGVGRRLSRVPLPGERWVFQMPDTAVPRSRADEGHAGDHPRSRAAGPLDQTGHMQETIDVPAFVCMNEQYPVAPQGFGVQVATPVESV